MLPRFELPLPAARFMREHWQKEPLLMRGAARGLAHPGAGLLAGLALEPEVESRIVSGQGPYRLSQGPFSADTFTQLPPRDWTLLVQSVDHYLTEVSLVLDSFDFLPAWRLEDVMISYATRGGGVGPHYDRYDVFLMQASGTRRWRLGPPCPPDAPLDPDSDLRVLRDMAVKREYVMVPGDVLYLPPWVAHWGLAEDDDCVTWSVGLRAPDPADLLDRAAEQAMVHRGGLYNDPERRPCDDPGVLSERDLTDLAASAASLLENTALMRCALGQLLSEPRQETLDFHVDVPHIRERAPEAALVRHGGARILVSGTDGDWLAWVNGEARPLTGGELPLARLLAARRLVSNAELQANMTPEGQCLLEEWIHDGYIQRIHD